MPVEEQIRRIQTYLREQARSQYQVVPLPPFTLFFHPTEDFKYFNYAIPDQPTGGELSDVLRQLREIFRSRGRVPRFEFFEAFAPALPAALLENGFSEEARQWSMLCTPQNLRSAPEVPELEVLQVTASSPAEDVRDFIQAQHQGFNPEDIRLPDDAAVENLRAQLRIDGAGYYLGRIAGQAAGAAMVNRPLDGITEVVGIATRLPFRRRGIAARLTWQATRHAFAQGAHTACLTAADEAAGRVYERVGFQPFSTMLAYIADASAA